MSFLLFLLTVTFFVLWLRARSSDDKDQSVDRYGQGYWDGYRAFGDKVAELLRSDEVSKHSLHRLVDEGNGVAVVDTADVATVRHEDLGIIPEGTDEYDDEPVETPRAIYTETVAPQPVLSSEDIAARKEKETLQNLNILLYVASFLIVAAAALFVTLVMPAGVKLFSLILVTLAFYVSGMVLYSNSLRLRPAATAFVGTGLAILPFIGFALTSLGGFSGEVAWLITSVVGLLAYAFAATRLQSELISYLTMAFVLSLALSAVSTLSLSIVWYFIVTIGVSLLCNSIHILWPNALPRIFAKPVEQTGQITTPIALVASFFTGSHMDLFMYEVLYGIATAHYLVVWLEKRELTYEVVVRVLAHVTLLIVAADVTNLAIADISGRVQFGIWVLALAVIQVVYSLLRATAQDSASRGQCERVFIVAALSMIWLSIFFWVGDEYIARWTLLSLTTVGVLSLAATLRLREAGWSYIGLVASAIIPYVAARGVAEPPVSYEVVAGGFTILALFALMGLERANSLDRSVAVRTLLGVAAGTYAMLVAISGLLTGEGVSIGWTMLLSGGIFIILSYLLRAVGVEIIGALLGIASVTAWVNESSIESGWQLLVTVVVSTALLLVGASVHHFNGESDRRTALAGLGAGVLACLLATAFGGVEIAVTRTATAILLLAAIAGIVLRFSLKDPKSTLTQISQLVYFSYPLLGLIVAWQAGLGWVALACAVYTSIFWLGSYVEKLPAVMIAGNIALMCTLSALWFWLEFDPEWQLQGTAWLGAAVFYGIYWLMVDKKDEWRQMASLVSVWVVLGLVVLAYIFASTSELVMAAAGSLLAIAVTLGIHGYLQSKTNYIEVAVYIGTFALQRMVAVLLPEANLVVYGHWWALTIGLIAWWRKGEYKTRAIIALAFVTSSTGIYALMGEPGYPLVFLVEHLLVLTAGALLRKSWVMWWGVISVVLAVLYFLRDYTFLAPLFLGILLIIFVVWRLTKIGKK